MRQMFYLFISESKENSFKTNKISQLLGDAEYCSVIMAEFYKKHVK